MTMDPRTLTTIEREDQEFCILDNWKERLGGSSRNTASMQACWFLLVGFGLPESRESRCDGSICKVLAHCLPDVLDRSMVRLVSTAV
jgi:hypothetical protein